MRNVLLKVVGGLVCLFCTSWEVMADGVIKGRILDAETRQALVGATVYAEGVSGGTAADTTGYFELKLKKAGKVMLRFRCVGYAEVNKEVMVDSKELHLGVIEMKPEVIGLSDVVVRGSLAVDRKTPVALSVITASDIENKLSMQEFPEILKGTPSVYVTKEGGAFGDGRINLRGFETENIAVMVNGVPVNEMEWGGIYWSNWSGLSDVTCMIQVQRGLGASKVSVPSVGGSINIVTNSTNAKSGASVAYSMGNDGYNKVAFSASTGLSENGWAMSILGARTWGDGYIQGTDFVAYSYFINISKKLGENHELSLTALGAPQWHNQRNRNDKMTIKAWKELDDTQFNPSYGFATRDGKEVRKVSAYNKYHKPQVSLNHLWQINEKSSLSNVIYMSFGRGGGYGGRTNNAKHKYDWFGTSNGAPTKTEFRRSDGTFNYDAVYNVNSASVTGSEMIMAMSKNEHNWYGLISTYTTKLGQYFDVYGGVDLRYYKGKHYNEIVDLYGGRYFIDDSRMKVKYKADDYLWQNEELKKGDIVYRNYDGYMLQEGFFAQGEYNRDALSVFVAGSLSNITYWREDHFYYPKDEAKSDKENFLGYTVKGGANYNLTENHNVFANIGYFSRAPYMQGGVFLQQDVSNETNPDAVNEKVFTFELGYGYRSVWLDANVNLYRTAWTDKTMANFFEMNGDRMRVNLTGLDALHQGIELDFVLRPVKDLKITGMFSIGDWHWNGNGKGYAYNSSGRPVDKEGNEVSEIGGKDHALNIINLKDVRVGNSAQTTFALGGQYQFLKGFHVGVDYSHFARNYAKFTPSLGYNLGAENTYESPWRMPAYGVLDANVSYRFPVGKLFGVMISGNLNNVLDKEYIADAEDGKGHDEASAKVFYGFGRTFSLRLKITF
ncbi:MULTISPECIES: TonB-dependent receptor [Butyricimonas]|uniref:TonB-dependent receptor n=1 Tax=Butyricimonas TaxID=574697 RepID=UPI0007FB3980|nr:MULTISPECIES: TonB-dependent receptor [Butyricimonas]